MRRQRCTPVLGAGSLLRTIGSTRIRWLAYDPWYYDEDDEEVVCPECKRTFELEITTVRTYRTKRRIEDMPDGWNGGELQ